MIPIQPLLEGPPGAFFLQRGLPSSPLYVVFWSIFFAGAFTGLGYICILLRQTAAAARDAVFETRRVAQAAFISQLLSEYASEEMTVAMRELYRWKETNPNDFAERFVALYRNKDPYADLLDSHRRRLYRFFHKLWVFRRHGIISADLAEDVTFLRVGGPFLIGVLEPIQMAHGQQITSATYDKDLFDYYRGLVRASDHRDN